MMLRLVRVSGNSLWPRYRDGDFIVISRIPVLLGMIAPGNVIAFKTKDFGTMIKMVDSISPDRGSIHVRGTHPLSVDSRTIGPVSMKDVIGRVIWHVRKPTK
jgi:hypothetical protein